MKAENLDAIFANNNEPNRVCLGNGDGTFGTPGNECSDVSDDVRLSKGVALGFMNNDSFLDAVFANQLPSERNQVCLGDGAGGFVCSDVNDPLPNPQSDSVALGLLDGDGNLDMAFALDPTTPDVIQQVCYGNEVDGKGDGTFSCILINSFCQPSGPLMPLTCSSFGVALGKVYAGTSVDNIVFANGTKPNVLCGDQFPFTCTVVNPVNTNASLDVALGLVDDDSFLDAVFANNGLNQVCLGDGSGGFSCSLFDATNSREVALGDFDPSLFISLSPNTATNNLPTDRDHAVTATVDAEGMPVPDILVTFEVISGPNAGLVSIPNSGECSPNDCTTDANGQVSWTYSGVIEGTDIIVASFEDQANQVIESDPVEKIWVLPTISVPIPTLTQWGLIAMVVVLGIVGFMVLRRRKVTT